MVLRLRQRDILIKINLYDIGFITDKLSMEQIIAATYELSDEKIIYIAKNLNINHFFLS